MNEECDSVASNCETGPVLSDLVWCIPNYDASVRYLFSSVCWDVQFLDEGYGIGAGDVLDSLC